MSNTIKEGQVGLINYTLTNEAGDILGTSADQGPLPYLAGHGNIVPGLEKALLGAKAGDKVQVIVPPEEGYGPRQDPPLLPVSRSEFPPDLNLYPGMPFQAETDDGRVVTLWVTGEQGDEVHVDHNHPLAGVTLHFDVEVVGIRGATPEELAHGHPHGPDGKGQHE